jgi:hypothetical protein
VPMRREPGLTREVPVELGGERAGIADADAALVRVPAGRPRVAISHSGAVYLSRSGPASTACAAASRATGTRNGEHDT